MARERRSKERRSSKGEAKNDDTLEVRVRRKNPLIERKATTSRRQSKTALSPDPRNLAAGPSSASARRALYGEDLEATDRSEELSSNPAAPLAYSDESATELAEVPIGVLRGHRSTGAESAALGVGTGAWPSALRVVRGILTSDDLAVLDGVLLGELDRPGIEPGLSPKRSLEHLVNEAGFVALTPGEQAALLLCLAASPKDISTTKAAIALLKTGVMKRTRPIEREHLLAVFSLSGPDLRALLAHLGARLHRNLSVLEDRDRHGTALVSHLHALCQNGALAPEMERRGVGRTYVMALLLGSIATPERALLGDGADGVLAIMEFALADSNPAELARLWRALVTDDMIARLPGKSVLDLGPRVRSSERFSFSTAETPIRLGLGLLGREGFVTPRSQRINAEIVARALKNLYGVGFTIAAGAENVLRHLQRSTVEPHPLPPTFLTLMSSRGERLFVYDHIDGSHVYLRAPHGRSTKRKGAFRNDPSREVQDPDTGLDRVLIKDFEAMVGGALFPHS